MFSFSSGSTASPSPYATPSTWSTVLILSPACVTAVQTATSVPLPLSGSSVPGSLLYHIDTSHPGLCSFCCPCIQFGRNVESHDSTMPCAGCCLCGLTCLVCTTWWPLSGGIGPACLILQNRINVRSELDYRVCSASVSIQATVALHHNSHISYIQRDDCVDFMKVVCCTLCVIAQDGRELKNHGRRSRHH